MVQGYLKKPILIDIFALIYLVNPIGNFLNLWLSSNRSFGDTFLWLGQLIASGNFVIIFGVFLWIASIILAIGLYNVKMWSWYYFIVHSILVFLQSFFYISASGETVIQFTRSVLINIIFLIPIGYFIRKSIRSIYFNPSLRWWKQYRRFRADFKVLIGWNEEKYNYQIFDLSENGVFVVTDKLEKVMAGAYFNVELEIPEGRKISTMGIVVWMNYHASVHKPSGFGLKFLAISPEDKEFLRRTTNKKVKEEKQLARSA